MAYAKSADTHQTAIPFNILRNNCIQNKGMEAFKILGHLPYTWKIQQCIDSSV